MIIVRPEIITEAQLLSSNILENDAPAWDSEATYATGDDVIFEHRVYESLADSNTDQPDEGAVADPPTWLDTGATNRFRMFDGLADAVSLRSGVLDVTVQPGGLTNCVALINARGIGANVQLIDDDEGVVYSRTQNLQDLSVVTDWFTYFYAPIVQRQDVVFLDLPSYRNTRVRVVITAGSEAAQLGELIVGVQRVIGAAVYGTNVGIRDFSRKEVDQFGNQMIRKRRFSKRVEYQVAVESRQTSAVQRQLALARATPMLFVGAEHREETLAYGFYRDFTLAIANPAFTDGSIDVESLAIDEQDPFFADAAVDAPIMDVPDEGESMPENGEFRTSNFSVQPAGEDTHAETDWQFSETADFAVIAHESLADAVNLITYQLPSSTLTVGTVYYVRALHRGTTSGDSPTSTPVKFTLAASATLGTPSITTPVNEGTLVLDTDIASSAFSSNAAGDVHRSSDWQIASDSAFSGIVWEVEDDSDNLTSLPPPLDVLEHGTTYHVRKRDRSRLLGASDWSSGVQFTAALPAGQIAFTQTGTHTFNVPAGVTQLVGLCVGAGGGGERNPGGSGEGGGGGGLRWHNAITVTPGELLQIEVGIGGNPSSRAGGASVIRRARQQISTIIPGDLIVRADGGNGISAGTGSARGGNIGGANGANGWPRSIAKTLPQPSGGGGAAAGYTGDGNSETGGAPSNGETIIRTGEGGGGVGLLGQGASGTTSGQAGSGGQNGSAGGLSGNGFGGQFGGGGGGTNDSGDLSRGAHGAVRILWGADRAYPSTNTADQ